MAGLGLLYIPLKDVVGTLSVSYFLVVISVVFTVIATGFVVSRFTNMYPIEAAIISACQSGMGGTGDVAILSTADRMNFDAFCPSSYPFRRRHHSDCHDRNLANDF